MSHAYLGIATAQTTGAQRGALVGSLQSGTPAARAGLRAGDVITSFNGATIASSGDLIDALAAAHPDEQVTITVPRDLNRITVITKLASHPSQAPSQ